MNIVGMDWETTGFFEPEHRIIEAAMILYDYEPSSHAWSEIERYDQRIDPQRDVPKKSSDVHGIYASDLIGKPVFKAVAPFMVDILNRADIGVAHNGFGFDFPFLIQELERVSSPIPDFVPFDTMIDGRWATPLGAAPNLQALCWACGVHYDPAEAHAGIYDVTRMMECFFFGLRRGTFTLPKVG